MYAIRSYYAKDEITVTVSGSSPPAIVELSEDVTEDLILEDIFTDDYTKVDYLVTTPISVSAKLTIRPGVRVAFAENSGMLIETTGAFDAEGGEAEEDIVITSYSIHYTKLYEVRQQNSERYF